jgi:hypothetical protein
MKRYLTNNYLNLSAKKIKHFNVKVQCDGWACFGEQSSIFIRRKVCCASLSSLSRAPQFEKHFYKGLEPDALRIKSSHVTVLLGDVTISEISYRGSAGPQAFISTMPSVILSLDLPLQLPVFTELHFLRVPCICASFPISPFAKTRESS